MKISCDSAVPINILFFFFKYLYLGGLQVILRSGVFFFLCCHYPIFYVDCVLAWWGRKIKELNLKNRTDSFLFLFFQATIDHNILFLQDIDTIEKKPTRVSCFSYLLFLHPFLSPANLFISFHRLKAYLYNLRPTQVF